MNSQMLELESEDLEYAVDRQRMNTSSITGRFLDRSLSELELRRQTCWAPQDVFHRTFLDILGEARETYFGRKHGLAQVRTMADWKRRRRSGAIRSTSPTSTNSSTATPTC